MIATSMIRTVPRIYKQKRQISKNTLKVGRLNAVTLHDLDNLPDDNSVYILVFNNGNYRDGLYSIQTQSNDDIPENIVLAFHSYDDAMRYGTLLDATMGQIPIVEMTHPFELQTLCYECGYSCVVASPGANLLPPDTTVKVTDYERSRALRMGRWSVQDPEIEVQRQMLSRMFEMDSDDHF